MDIQLGSYPQALVLVLARVAALMFTVPFYGAMQIPPGAKMMFAFVITLAILPVVPPEWASQAARLTTTTAMFVAVLYEILIGVAVGLICDLFVSTVLVAGEVMSLDSGLSMAQSVDPLSGHSSPVLAQVLQTAFVLFVLLTNGHLVLLKILAASFGTVRGGVDFFNNDFLNVLLSSGSIMFEWGIRLAMPLIAVALMLNVCMGLISKLAPEFDILFLSLPIRLGAGIAVFGMMLGFCGGIFERLTGQMLSYCAGVLGKG